MFIYQIFIGLYKIVAQLLGLFDAKARKWINGRDHWKSLDIQRNAEEKLYWFHCASVGEFEQARPVIEGLKSQIPESKIVLTFFSPSGYELRKNYEYADFVTYLPTDTKSNARLFLDKVKADFVVFVKYEFWFNLMNEVHVRRIPFYLISAHFPKNHFLLKWPGSLLGKRLTQFDRIFLQDGSSAQDLRKIGVTSVEIAGDTRFDRVEEGKKSKWNNAQVSEFVGDEKVLVIGSNWSEDDKVILPVLQNIDDFKVIVAPHEIKGNQWTVWSKTFDGQIVKWSEMEHTELSKARVLFVDTVGVLSKLYRFGTAAFVGGGFGAGLHNTLEAAVYGIPVIFGPNNKRFLEVQTLKELGVGLQIENTDGFIQALLRAMKEREYQENCTKVLREYFDQNIGASQKIIQSIINE
ncbi:MAG: glycosyltransferase N-terminal domain-containing protein [Flavobacteriales bacterium]